MKRVIQLTQGGNEKMVGKDKKDFRIQKQLDECLAILNQVEAEENKSMVSDISQSSISKSVYSMTTQQQL